LEEEEVTGTFRFVSSFNEGFEGAVAAERGFLLAAEEEEEDEAGRLLGGAIAREREGGKGGKGRGERVGGEGGGRGRSRNLL